MKNSPSTFSPGKQCLKGDEDNISINSEKAEQGDLSHHSPSGSLNIIVNASFSKHNHEMNQSQLDQQSIISNMINTKKDDMRSVYSFITNDIRSQCNFPRKKTSGISQTNLKKSNDEESLLQV